MKTLHGLQTFAVTRLLLLAAVITVSGSVPALGAITVSTTIPPVVYIIGGICGDLAEVNVLVPPGADPHGYEPRPRQMAQLSDSEVYFSVGVDFEDAWMSRFRATNPDMTVIALDAGIDKIPVAGHHDHGANPEHDDDHDTERPDPHIWLSPPRMAKMAETAHRVLVEHYPEHRDLFAVNHERLQAEISGVHTRLSSLFGDVGEHNRFLVFHPAWGYLADTYGLVQNAVEIEGKEPRPGDLAVLVTEIRRSTEGDIPALFVQPQISPRAAQTVADALDTVVIPIDPLAADWAANIVRAARRISDNLY